MPEQDNYDDELVSSNPNQRNWRGILIALLVIIIVLALIVTSVVLLTPPDEGPRVKGQRIKLQDIVDGAYIPHRANGTWINAEDFIYQDQWGRISLLNVGNLSDRVLMSNLTIKTLSPSMFTISPDKSYILLAQNIQKIYRHSYLAQYTVFDIQTSESIKLKIDFGSDEWPYLQYAQFTPSGSAIIIVYNYNIYYLPRLRPSHVFPITRDGVPGIIYNGIPDWLYEEEILESNNAIWMSADGHLMLYASFNDSNVQEQYFAWYGLNSEHTAGNSFLYPEIKTLRYPKPGTHNPTVRLRVADLANPKDIRYQYLKPPYAVAKEDHYVASASWISQTEVCVVWLNRPQNISIISICKSPLFHCLEIQKISGDGRGWVDTLSVPLFAMNASSYVTISPLRDGASGYFRHIVHVHVSKRHVLPLTHGQYEVNKLLHWDQINQLVYFLGTPERKPSQQHLYRVSAIPPRLGSPLQPPHCLTCPPSKHGSITTKPPPRLVTAWDDDWEDGPQTEPPSTTTQPPDSDNKIQHQRPQLPQGANNCLFYTALFPNTLSAKYVLIDCLGPVVPTSAIYSISATTRGTKLPAGGGIIGTKEEYYTVHPMQLVMTIQNNTRLRNKIAKTALPQIKTFPVVVSGGYHAQVRIFLPPVLREDEITRYPTILHVYSGPGTQLVTEKWHIDWNTYLSAAKDYVVIQIDARGSSGQGYQLLHEVYKRLGTVEVSDQLEVSEYLRDNLPFIDGRRMGVWGWSYGGYTAALTLASAQSIFQCGISVAPVSNWKLYDSAYAERYLSFPNVTDNYKGYEEGDLTKYVDNLRDKQYLLVHGTADDNVHLQQSMFLSRALTTKGVLYKQQIYPDEGHSLSGVKRHLYRSMTAFFDDCFKKLVPPEIKAGLGNGGEPQQQ